MNKIFDITRVSQLLLAFIATSYMGGSIASGVPESGYDYALQPSSVSSIYWYDPAGDDAHYSTVVQFRFVDADQLRLLKLRTQAAIAHARYTLENESSHEQLNALKRERIRAQISYAEQRLAEIDGIISEQERYCRRIRLYSSALKQLRSGIAKPENIAALRYFAAFDKKMLVLMNERTIDELSSDQFKPRGSLRLVPTGDGRLVRRDNWIPTAFPDEKANSQTIAAYLDFLNRYRQDVIIGTPAHDVLVGVIDEVSEAAKARLAELNSNLDESERAFIQQNADIQRLIEDLQSSY